jgi:hypothetical protein
VGICKEDIDISRHVDFMVRRAKVKAALEYVMDNYHATRTPAKRASLLSAVHIYEFNARRSFVSGGFCYELPVVDGPFVYNGFVSWPFYYISFVRYWYLDLPLSQDYNNEVLHRFVMYCVTYACGDCVAPRSELYMCMRTVCVPSSNKVLP